MSYPKEYNPTITDQLDELILIGDMNLDESLADVLLFRENKEEFQKKHFPFGLGFQFVFNNDKTKDDRYIILLLDRIEETLNKLYHIHFFIEINEEHIEWTEELDRSWNTLDNLKRRDLLSCKYGLQRILLDDNTIDKTDEKHWIRQIRWDSLNKENITVDNNFPKEQNEIVNNTLPTRRRPGRPLKTEKIFDIDDEGLAKIFYILSLAKVIPYDGNKIDISSLYSRITGHGRENVKRKMNFEPIDKVTKEKIIERLKDAITRFENQF
jgi:hypothetical protein